MNIFKSLSSYSLYIVTGILFLFLYIPIFVLIVFSFNNSYTPYQWGGLTLQWYYNAFTSSQALQALKNSGIVALSSSLLSVVMGTLFVLYSAHSRLQIITPLFLSSLGISEIIIAVGLLHIFSMFVIPLGLTALIAGHTLLGLGYVIPMLSVRYSELDKRYWEASLDLGASEVQTYKRIILPLLRSTLFTAALLVFIISLDDFLIAFFCSSPTSQTLPLYIFSVIRSGATPEVNALSTIMIVLSSALVLLISRFSGRQGAIL
ncbi:ABC transporter permease [Vermiphilus pyriformis]|nr:MAG: ABC transporter permease [Vermiphilus pyriformis]